jgi:hypothetical protein
MQHPQAERELSDAAVQALAFDEAQDPIDIENSKLMEEGYEAIRRMCDFLVVLGAKVKDKDIPGALKDLGDELFRYEGDDRLKLIRGVATIIDPVIISEYLDRIWRDQAPIMAHESEFRVAIKSLEMKWSRNVRLKILPILFMYPKEEASNERRVELSRIRNAYNVIPFTLDEHNAVINLHPDDRLLEVVSDIIGKGKRYTTLLGMDNGFNGFLSELVGLIKRHEAGKLPAHLNLDLSTPHSKDEMIKILALGNIRLLSRLESVVYELQQQRLSHLVASEKEIKALNDRIARLQNEIVDLKLHVQHTNVNQEQVKLLKQENSQLKRDKETAENSAKKTEKQLMRVVARQESQLAIKDVQITRLKKALAEKDMIIDELSRDNESLLHATGSDVSGAEMTDEDAIESFSPQGSSPQKKTISTGDAPRLMKARKKLFNDTQSADSSFSTSASPQSVSPPNVVKSQGVVDSKKGFFQPSCGAQDVAASAEATYPKTIIDNLGSINTQQPVRVGGTGPGL